MKNRFCLFLLGLTAAGGLFAQNVDRLELENNQAAINWINYEGPHSRIDTVEQIRNIGVELGRAIKNGAQRAGAGNRYFVIHCVSDPDGDKLDADVFGFGVDVGVDHIRNLRLIIQGYLQGAYDYSASDAAVLARFVTVYNAVFRGDWNFFSTRYKSLVVENLTAEKAGISIRFDEWPGQTLMTIPLGTGNSGDLSAIDTSNLTDSGVIDQMRSTDDRGIEERQGMVDIKEREADEANQSATLQRGVIEEEEKNIQRDQEDVASTRRRVEDQQREAEAQRRQAEQQRQEAEAQRRQAEQAAAAGTLSQEEAARQQQEAEAQRRQAEQQQQEADTRRQEAQRQAEEADQKQREIDQRQQDQEQRRQEADAAQQKADQKTAEAQQERQQIAQDQQDIIDNKAAAAAAGSAAPAGLLAAVNLQRGNSLGRLVRVDPSTLATVQSSQVNTLNTRTVTMVGNRIVGIAGINRGNGAVRLVEIDSGTLEMLKQGDDDINPDSLLWLNGSSLYAIASSGGKNYIARFDAASFAKQAQSTAEVHPYASCFFQGGKVLTQKADGTPLILDPQTLK